MGISYKIRVVKLGDKIESNLSYILANDPTIPDYGMKGLGDFSNQK
jgi:hypothetical protein